MPSICIDLTVSKEAIPVLEAYLAEVPTASMSIVPIYADDDGSVVNPPWNWATATAYVPLATDLPRFKRFLSELDVKINTVKIVGDKDWIEEWEQSLRPSRYGSLQIVPKKYPLDGDSEYVVRLDPGLAFGTGEHESTALCLEWLARQDLKGKAVLDAGCGSGILSISAAKLGAKKVIGVDIDPQALFASKENIEFNDVSVELREDFDLQQKVDVILANILLDTLLDLAKVFETLLDEEGVVLLSGILADQADLLMRSYSFLEFEPIRRRGTWVLLIGRRSR